MSTGKVVAVVVVCIVVIGVISVGGAYLATSGKQKKAMESLRTAKDLLENNKTDAAVAILKEHTVKYPRDPSRPGVLFLLGKTLFEKKKTKSDAMVYFDQLMEKYPDSGFTRQARYYKAISYLDKRPVSSRAREFFEITSREKGNPDAVLASEFGLALAALDDGETDKAFSKMNEILEASLDDDLKNRVEETLGGLNMRLLLSPEIQKGDEYYKIQKGDYIYNLARKYNVTQELLMKCNNITDPKRISISQRIKIPNVNFSLEVNIYNNTLILMSNGKFFKKYKVRTGQYAGDTPTGEFRIINKKKNPDWRDPQTHKKFKGGDPGNELGSRWMAFQGSMLGIHAAIRPETIGYYSSQGCVGMLKEDIEELYELIPVGTSIKIVGKRNPELIEKSRKSGFRE